MRRLAACVLACALVAGAAGAADISGYVDAGYNWNLEGRPANEVRLYGDDPDTFLLNAAHLRLSGGFSETSEYVVELDIGYNNSIESWAAVNMWSESLIQEAYIDSKLGDNGVSLRAGKFEAFSGMEGMDSPDNCCISRGLIFSYGLPRTYTGAVLGYSDRQFDARLGLVNGWNTLVDSNSKQSLLLTASVSPSEDFSVALSYLNGPETADPDLDRSTLDLVLSYRLSSQAEIDVEYTSSTEETAGVDEEWSGIGVQALIKHSDAFSLGLRYESFDDTNGVRLPGVGQGKCTSLSLAPAFSLSGSSTIRFEFRIDKADDANAFLDSDGNPTDTQKTFAAQVYTTF